MKCQPTKPATRPAFTPLGAFLREVLKADHEDTKALGAWEAEVSRVRKKHPVCPATVEDAGVDRRWVPSAERWLQEGIATGHIKKSSSIVRDFREWKAACKAIDDQHIDRSFERKWKAGQAKFQKLDARFGRAPAKSLADVRAKLDYILHYEHFSDGGCRKVAYRLRHDVPAWEAVSW